MEGRGSTVVCGLQGQRGAPPFYRNQVCQGRRTRGRLRGAGSEVFTGGGKRRAFIEGWGWVQFSAWNSAQVGRGKGFSTSCFDLV